MNKEREKLLKDFEAATERVMKLKAEYDKAVKARDQLRKQMRAALGGKTEAVAMAVPASLMEAEKALKDFPKPFSAKDLAQALNIEEVAARNRLLRGTQLGLFERVGRGTYRLAVTTEGASVH